MSFGASIGLLYHRVAETGFDPFGIAVTPAHFSEHVEVLRTVRVLPFARFADLAAGGRLPAGSTTITFDDGYRDNADHAAPALAAHDLPATIFVPAAAVGSDRAYWWDALTTALAPLPGDVTVTAAGTSVTLSADRGADILALWSALRRRPFTEVCAAIDALHARFGGGWTAAAAARVCDAAMLRALSDDAPIEIGAHTITHPSLGSHPRALQAHEVATGRALLEEMLERPVTTLAYPYGRPRIDVTRTTVAVARAAGVTAACTVDDREIRSRCNPLAIRRWMVPDVDGAAFERMLHARLRGAGPVRRVAREVRRALLDVRDR